MKRSKYTKYPVCSKQKTRNQPMFISRRFTYTESERTNNFKTIQSEVNATLTAFEKEREKQINTVDRMREQLKSLTNSTESLIKSSATKTSKIEDRCYTSTLMLNNNINNSTRSKHQVVKTKGLSNIMAENERLKEEIKMLRKEQQKNTGLIGIRSKLLRLVGGDEDCEEKDINELFEMLEDLIVGLIKERNGMEKKYIEIYNNSIKNTHRENYYNDERSTPEISNEEELDFSTYKNYLSKSKDDINNELKYRTEISTPRNEPKDLKERIIKLDKNLKTIESKRKSKSSPNT